jgi:hypothetical protein
MPGILDMLGSHLDAKAVQQISGRLGTDRNATSTAIAAALPVLLGALAKNSSNPDGAQALNDALARDHDGSRLERGPAVAESDRADGDAILGHVLGDRRELAERGIAKASGLDLAKIGPLLAMLAPVVMGALGKTRRERGLGPQDLSVLLGGESDAINAASPGMMGMVSRLLDRDGDGSVVDDLGGMLGGLLGRR